MLKLAVCWWYDKSLDCLSAMSFSFMFPLSKLRHLLETMPEYTLLLPGHDSLVYWCLLSMSVCQGLRGFYGTYKKEWQLGCGTLNSPWSNRIILYHTSRWSIHIILYLHIILWNMLPTHEFSMLRSYGKCMNNTNINKFFLKQHRL